MSVEQKTRFTNKELSLLKNTFVDNDELLKIIRKVILQIELTEAEDTIRIKTFKDDVSSLIRKIFLPEIDGDAPLHQVVDPWATLRIDDKDIYQAHLHIEARRKFIAYIKQQLDVIDGTSNIESIKFEDYLNDTDDKEEKFINLIIRQTILAHVEQQLMQIKLLAGTKDETPEETLERLHQDSSR